MNGHGVLSETRYEWPWGSINHGVLSEILDMNGHGVLSKTVGQRSIFSTQKGRHYQLRILYLKYP